MRVFIFAFVALALSATLVAAIPSVAFAQDTPAPVAQSASTEPCSNLPYGEAVVCRSRGFFGRSGYETVEGAENPLALRIGIIVRTMISLVGIVFLMITVYSGIRWMMAGGNEEVAKLARTRMTRAVVGVMIIVGAWVITNFVIGSALRGPQQPDTRTIRPFVR